MRTRTWLIASLLAASGFCALVYQVAWLREFRLKPDATPAVDAADGDLNEYLATAPRPLVSR